MQTYSITPFAGPNPVSVVWTMNQSGVVGGYILPSGPGPQFPLGTIWPINGAAQLVGLNSQVLDVNNAGDAVGGMGTNVPFTGGPDSRAFLFKDGQLIDMSGRMGGGAIASVARGINDSGLITGHIITNSGDRRGFVYDSAAQTFTLIGLLPGNVNASSFGLAINSSGVVVAQVAGHACTLINGKLTDLGPLNSGGDVDPFDINDAGRIVVTRRDNNVSKPLLYDLRNPNAGLTDIPLPPGFVEGTAVAINNSGDIVGRCVRSDGSASAFINSGNSAELSSLIPGISGWVLTDVRDINDLGYIVGMGLLNGKATAYILRPNVIRGGLGVFGLILQVSLGVMVDGGGTVSINGHPVPVDPWGGLTAFQQDVLLGLATEEQAKLINDKTAQSAIRQAALELVKNRVTDALNSLRGK